MWRYAINCIPFKSWFTWHCHLLDLALKSSRKGFLTFLYILANTEHWELSKLRNFYNIYKYLLIHCLKGVQIMSSYNQKFIKCCQALESRYVSDIQIISNLWIAIYAFRRNIFGQLYANILLKFQLQKVLTELCLGPGSCSVLPPGNSKTLCNHVDIHILVMATKSDRAFLSFWSHCRCCVLLPGTLLEVIQI